MCRSRQWFRSEVPVPYPGVESEIGTNLCGCVAGDPFRYLAVGIFKVTKHHGAATGVGTRFDTGRLVTGINPVHTKGAAFYRAFASRGVGLLVFKDFVHK